MRAIVIPLLVVLDAVFPFLFGGTFIEGRFKIEHVL